MPSFYIPLSGLDADSTALNTIANNLSNMNTNGFKSQTTTFSDLLYQQLGANGSGDQIQVGSGVQVATNSTDFTSGDISSTGISTDAAIDGAGFFILDAGSGNQSYTQNGSFQVSTSGLLQSADGLSVMGYSATNGVVNTSGALSDISVPTGQVMQPSATTTMSTTQNLDSADAIGATVSGEVPVYDSLGNSYQATITYTKTANNTWAYNVTIPDTLSAAPTTAAAATTMAVAESTPTATSVPDAASITSVTAPAITSTVNQGAETTASLTSPVTGVVAGTTTNYNFLTSNSLLATVDPTTALTITEGATVVSIPATTGESVSSYATALQSALTSAGISDVTVTGTGGVLSIANPAATATVSGTVAQGFTGTETGYTFGTYTDPTTGLSAPATVAATTSLAITGPTTAGGTTTKTVTIPPANLAGTPPTESAAQYATDVNTALAAAGITGVTASYNAGTNAISFSGPTNMTIAGTGIVQNMAGTTNTYAFESKATVDPTTNFTITGETTSGTQVTIKAPIVTAGETITQYATALTSALSTANVANVSVTANASTGQLAIVGANMSTSGTINQGLADTTINYNFGSTGTVNPATNLTIVGPTVSGSPATAITVAPTVFSGETVAEYATALNNALTSAGINTGTDGVTVTSNGGQLSIVGPAASLKTSGTASQDLTATTVSYNFGSSKGILATVDPATNLTITGQTTNGSTATIVAPTVLAGDTLAQYVSALNAALTASGITGVQVSNTTAGVLSITGANLSTSGKVVQDPVASAAASGTLTFDTNGNLVSPANDVAGITFSGLSDGAATMNVNWGLYGASGTGEISQTSATSSTSATSQNGYSSGEYESFAVNSSGLVTATYSNSQSQVVGQLAVATVVNEEGLKNIGSTEYQTTSASGAASVGVAGTGGRGTIEGSSLEASNVNISAEFSDLIVAQRAFEANSKAVTTFDTITQETINMIH